MQEWCTRIRRRLSFTRAFDVALIGLALVALPSADALAQNPFAAGIDGTVTAGSNSGITAVPANTNPPCVIGANGSSQACMVTDPNGATKEPGPINSNTTKIGVINTAPTPMLGDTNPNSNTDINTVFSQTAKATNFDLWYYFGWIRDSAGTGFLAVEFQHNPLDAGCINTSGAKPVVDYTLASCNPWKGRQGGTGANADFLILWDQSGSSTDIIKRNFLCSNGAAKCTGALVVLATCPNVITSTNPADACHRISAADAAASFGLPPPSKQVTFDTSRGELAIDLTTQVFAAGTCQSFANIIPGTVTGNSDSADYKDVVLSPFPPISNCGSVTITKQTDPQGRAGTFTYTLAAGGSNIFNTGGVDSDCTVSGADVTQCRGTLTTTTTAPYNDTDTIANLVEHGNTWTLTEDTPSSDFTLKSIDCVDSEGGTYHLFGVGQNTVATFLVEAGATTACTIVNTFVKAKPTGSTVQAGRAFIKDSITVTGIKAGASDASNATVRFALYAGNPCVDPAPGVTGNRVYLSDPIGPLTYTNNNTQASAAMPDTAYQQIAPGVTYYWQVTYSGDAYNTGFTTSCTSETATATFTFIQ